MDNKLLSQACIHGDVLKVHELLEKGVDQRHDHNYPLRVAAKYGFVNVVYVLLKAGADPSAMNNYAFRMACARGHFDTVLLLLDDSRVDPAAKKNEAFKAAARNGHYEIVRILLTDRRVNPCVRQHTPFMSAVKNGHLEIVRLMNRHIPITDSSFLQNAIFSASIGGHTPVLKLLMENNIWKDTDPDYLIKQIVIYAILTVNCDTLDYIHSTIKFSSYGIMAINFMKLAIYLANNKYDLRNFPSYLVIAKYDCLTGDTYWKRNKISRKHMVVVDRLFSYPLYYKISAVSGICFDHIGMIHTRATEICMALQELNLPALQMVQILDEIIPNCIRLWALWELVTRVKHFHDR